jgi:hypothetical protein
LAKIGGATLAFSLILEVRQCNLPDFGSEKMAATSKHMVNTWSIQREPSFELQTGKILLKRRLNMNALEKSTPLRTSSVRGPVRSKGEFTKSDSAPAG